MNTLIRKLKRHKNNKFPKMTLNALRLIEQHLRLVVICEMPNEVQCFLAWRNYPNKIVRCMKKHCRRIDAKKAKHIFTKTKIN